MIIEAAKLAPHWNEQLAIVHEQELKKGNRNRATLAVARRLVAYLLAVEKRQTAFFIYALRLPRDEVFHRETAPPL